MLIKYHGRPGIPGLSFHSLNGLIDAVLFPMRSIWTVAHPIFRSVSPKNERANGVLKLVMLHDHVLIMCVLAVSLNRSRLLFGQVQAHHRVHFQVLYSTYVGC